MPRALLVGLFMLFAAMPVATAATSEIALPEGWGEPDALAVDETGMVWFTLQVGWRVGRYDPVEQSWKAWPLSPQGRDNGDALFGLAIQDGVAWTASTTHLHRVDSHTDAIASWPLPAQTNLAGGVHIDESGRVWAALVTADKLARFDPTTETFKVFDAPAGSGPLEFVAANEATYLSATYGNTFATLDSQTGEIQTGAPNIIAAPTGIAVVSGILWLGEHGDASLFRYDPVTLERTRFPTAPSPFYPTSGPSGVAAHPDGSLWFAEHFADRISRFDPATRTLVEYQVANAPGANIQQVRVAPDGTMWFAEFSAGAIGTATYSGETPELTLPASITLSEGSETTFTIDGTLTPIVGTGNVVGLSASADGTTISVSAKQAPAGTFPMLVSRQVDATTWAGGYVDVIVTPADDGAAGVPAASPLAVLIAIFVGVAVAPTLRRVQP